MTLPPQEIRAAPGLKIAIQIRLPSGSELCGDLPVQYRIDPEATTGIVDRDSLGKLVDLKRSRPRFEVVLPITAAEGKDWLRFSLVYGTCRIGAGNEVTPCSVVWSIPLRFSPRATRDRVQLQTPIAGENR